MIMNTAANTVRYQTLQSSSLLGKQSSTTLILVGTAAPRHNKIHVFIEKSNRNEDRQFYLGLTQVLITVLTTFVVIQKIDNQ